MILRSIGVNDVINLPLNLRISAEKKFIVRLSCNFLITRACKSKTARTRGKEIIVTVSRGGRVAGGHQQAPPRHTCPIIGRFINIDQPREMKPMKEVTR